MHTDSSASRTYLASAVGLGVHCDGLDAQFAAGALDTQGDFTAIGYEYFFEHLEMDSQALGAIGARVHSASAAVGLTDQEQGLAVLDRLAILDYDLFDHATLVGFDFVQQLHSLDDAERVARTRRCRRSRRKLWRRAKRAR